MSSPSASRSRRRLVYAVLPILLLLLHATVSAAQQDQEGRDSILIPNDISTHPFHRRDGSAVTTLSNPFVDSPLYLSANDDKDCPPCFNCMLPAFQCTHFANCSEYNGKCHCPAGFGGDDCSKPREYCILVLNMQRSCVFQEDLVRGKM